MKLSKKDNKYYQTLMLCHLQTSLLILKDVFDNNKIDFDDACDTVISIKKSLKVYLDNYFKLGNKERELVREILIYIDSFEELVNVGE